MNGRIQVMAGLLALTFFVSAISTPVRSLNGSRVDRRSVKLPDRETVWSDSVKTDPETGLAIDDQLMLVKGQCTACHSSKLILQSHFSREKWVERIRWMQRTQKLWDLGESEPVILAYLTKYYGPIEHTFDGRRELLNAVKWHKLTN